MGMGIGVAISMRVGIRIGIGAGCKVAWGVREKGDTTANQWSKRMK